MKKLIFSLLVIFGWQAGLAPHALAVSFINQADIDIVNNFVNSVDELTNKLDASEVKSEEIQLLVDKIAKTSQAVDKHHFNREISGTYLDNTEAFKKNAREFNALAQQLPELIRVADSVKLNKAIDDYNQFLIKFDQISKQNEAIVKELNKPTNTKSIFYMVLFMATLGLAISLFLWYLNSHHHDPELRRSQRNIVLSSLLPLVGTGFTFFNFQETINKGSGNYSILYGPIIVGLIALLSSGRHYLKRKHSINSQPQK